MKLRIMASLIASVFILACGCERRDKIGVGPVAVTTATFTRLNDEELVSLSDEQRSVLREILAQPAQVMSANRWEKRMGHDGHFYIDGTRYNLHGAMLRKMDSPADKVIYWTDPRFDRMWQVSRVDEPDGRTLALRMLGELKSEKRAVTSRPTSRE
jgi:hypothetical protein